MNCRHNRPEIKSLVAVQIDKINKINRVNRVNKNRVMASSPLWFGGNQFNYKHCGLLVSMAMVKYLTHVGRQCKGSVALIMGLFPASFALA